MVIDFFLNSNYPSLAESEQPNDAPDPTATTPDQQQPTQPTKKPTTPTSNKKCLVTTTASTYAIDENDAFQFGFSNLKSIESDALTSKLVSAKTKKQKLRDYLDVKGVKYNPPSVTSRSTNISCYLVNDQFGSESLKRNVPVHINSVKIKAKSDSMDQRCMSAKYLYLRSIFMMRRRVRIFLLI